MQEGMRMTDGRPFQVLTNLGPTIVLPKHYCDEIRNDPRLSFRGFIERVSCLRLHYPGLDVVHVGTQDDIIQTTIRKNLNQALGGLTQALSSECASVLRENLQPAKEWTQTKFIMTATQIAARLSARVFLGERLCHNNEWIEISIRFTVVMMRAQDALRSWPLFLRPFVHWFIPELIYLKRLIKDARKIIEPELDLRMAERPDVLKPQDSLSWLEDVRAGRPFDVVSGQLFLTVAAIHTTSVVITALMYDLVKNPEYIHLLWEEAIKVYREDKEWNKTSLYKLKLLDSCMKESQRLNILGPNMMNRRAEDAITLSDGLSIPKGAHITFNCHRFLWMRQKPGEENQWQFVSTSPEFLSFGHGNHACPWRFFASNEIKIAIIQLLLHYEWKMMDKPPQSRFASRFVPDPETLIAYKSRTPEIEF
ncbi:P450 monooxygenase [Diaporthe sp. PMI_573]|nr:P450 monooxygenase [Diaporthaceae sp. PMI_573]